MKSLSSALAVLIGCVSINSWAAESGKSLKSLALEIRNARQVAQSRSEFHQHPHGVDATVQKLADKIELQGGQVVCEEFTQLDTQHLVELNSALDEMNPTALPCMGALNQKVELYYEAAGSVIDPGPSLQNTANTGSSTQEIFLNDSNGGLSLPNDVRLGSKVVALTFDDGPHHSYTDKILAILEEEGVTATFFVQGVYIKSNPGVLQSIASHGHAIGTHTWNHEDLQKVSYETGKRQIERGFQAAFDVLGYVDPFFRFPYGARTTKLKRYLREARISDFHWNVDAQEWKNTNPDDVLRILMNQITSRGNGLVLMHDTEPPIRHVIRPLIRALKNKGYSFAVFRAQN